MGPCGPPLTIPQEESSAVAGEQPGPGKLHRSSKAVVFLSMMCASIQEEEQRCMAS